MSRLSLCPASRGAKHRSRVRINNSRDLSTSSEFAEGVTGVASGLLQLKEPPGIVHQVLLVLGVHSVHLPVLAALVKQRAQEELSKPAGGKRGQRSHRASAYERHPALHTVYQSLFKESRKQLYVSPALLWLGSTR